MKFKITPLVMDFPHEGQRMLLVAVNRRGEILGSVNLTAVTSSGKNATPADNAIVHSVQFTQMFVTAGARRKGVGRMLLARAEAEANKARAEVISCYVNRSNTPGLNFYKACGYLVAFIYDDGDICMSKRLQP